MFIACNIQTLRKWKSLKMELGKLYGSSLCFVAVMWAIQEFLSPAPPTSLFLLYLFAFLFSKSTFILTVTPLTNEALSAHQTLKYFCSPVHFTVSGCFFTFPSNVLRSYNPTNHTHWMDSSLHLVKVRQFYLLWFDVVLLHLDFSHTHIHYRKRGWNAQTNIKCKIEKRS